MTKNAINLNLHFGTYEILLVALEYEKTGRSEIHILHENKQTLS